MSSSNLVRITYAKETVYNETPVVTGAVAASSAVVQGITFTAVTAGVAGNVTLTFNGTTDTPATVKLAWNTANPTNQITYTPTGNGALDDDLVILTPSVPLTGGLAGTGGDFSTMRYTSESLSGTPNVIESAEARADRQSAGQVTASITVEGDINSEMSAADCLKDFAQSAMMDATWSTAVASGATSLAITVVGNVVTVTAVGGTDLTTIYAVGDLISLSGFTAPENNTMIYVTAVTPTVLTGQGKGMINEAANAAGVATLNPYVEIGKDLISFSIEKAFLDLTNKSLLYTGMLANTMSINMAYGEIVTSTFGMAGADYSAPAVPITNGRTIIPATTETPFNASADVGYVLIDSAISDFCIQSLTLELNNNLRPQECLGYLNPQGQTPGTAVVNVTMSAYLADENWTYIQKKIESTPVSIVAFVSNSSGGFAFSMPKVQLTFPDPSSGGKDQDVVLDLAGLSSAPDGGGSSLRLYWF